MKRMYLRYITTHLRRGFITNALFCLLLTLSASLLFLSVGLWYPAHKAILDIDKSITTIAVPDRFAISKYVENDGTLTTDFIMAKIHEDIYASGLFEMDKRRVFGAYSPNLSPVPLRMGGLGTESTVASMSGQSFAVMTLTCHRLEDEYVFNWLAWEEDKIIAVNKIIRAYFSVDEIIHLHNDLIKPFTLEIPFYILNSDGSAPVEVGRQYLATGNYWRSPGLTQFNLNFDGEFKREKIGELDELDEAVEIFNNFTFSWMEIDEIPFPLDLEHLVLREGCGGYSLYDTAGVTDLEEIITTSEITANSFYILTSNNPNSLYSLNQRRNYIRDGRTFTAREIKRGARVCLVSTQFAEHNGLKVGDIIPLEFFASILSSIGTSFSYEDGRSREDIIWSPSGYSADLPRTDALNFRIVGLYETFKAQSGNYAISPSTVIIPDTSFAGISGEPTRNIHFVPDYPPPLLSDSLIVQNGEIEEARIMMNNISPGFGQLFKFFDQGYVLIMVTLSNMRFAMSWVLVMAVIGWAAVAFMFALFYNLRKRNEAELLHALGIGERARFRWVFLQCGFVIVFSQILALAVTIPLYNYIFDTTVRAAFRFSYSFRDSTLSEVVEVGIRRALPLVKNPSALIFTAIIGTMVLLLISFIVSAKIAVFNELNDRREVD